MTWHGEANTAYFVEFSTDLITWEYLPFTHRGQGQEVPFWYESSNPATSMYLRVKWLSNAPMTDADQDGASDLYEVSVLGSDPLVAESWVKYFADHDGDGIIDLDEVALGLDPEVADSPESESVLEAGPVLVTHSYFSHYVFNDGIFSQGQWGAGTRNYQISESPPEGGAITESVSLSDFKQDYLNFDFPLDGAELAREDAYGSQWLCHKVLLPEAPHAIAHRKSELNGDQSNNWRVRHTAHMVKLPFPTDREQKFHFLEVPTYRSQLTLTPYTSTGPPGESEWEKKVRLYGITDHGIVANQVAVRTLTIPGDESAPKSASNIIEIRPELPAIQEGAWTITSQHLLPILNAPEVLPVNSDFDEGRIDPATGYAIPDCDDVPGVDRKTGTGNGPVVIDAVIDHLDGLFDDNEQITDDMHEGWFGVHPQAMDDHFWDGATVTIKKLDRIDPDTGHKESGQVRFYAKWENNGSSSYYGIEPYEFDSLDAVNLVTSGINNEPNESVYGSNSQIPENAIYWMEGVRPGKITLEWRLQKDDVDVKHEQTFLVTTQQSLADWREEVRYEIRLQTKELTGSEVDLAKYYPSHGFRNTSTTPPAWHDNRLRVRAIYYYYQQLFKQRPEEFMWAGMAKIAAAPIYAGMSDLTTWWQSSYLFPPFGTDDGVETLIEGLLLSGQIAIFTDKAWGHRAYIASGKWALDWVKEDVPEATDYEAWDDLNQGILDGNQPIINTANRDLLEREQFEVIQQYYFDSLHDH